MTPASEPSGNERALRYEVLPEDEGLRLDLFLNDRMVWRSRSSIRRLMEKGKVCLLESPSGTRSALKPSRKVRSGEIYSVVIPVPRREAEALEEGLPEIPVLYEDEWIVVVNKPAGIPVHPGGRLLDRTVITRLNEVYRARAAAGTPLKLCHRLDLETSGVLLVSKDTPLMPRLTRQFERRQAKKEYLALVHGEMEGEAGEIDLPIGMAKESRINLKRGIDLKAGQPARTSWKVERRLPGFTLVRLRLHTGRHHQIRVHLSAVGHPIVGDKAYGVDENLFLLYHQGRLDAEARARLLLPRQALHAARLTILHPARKEEMTFEAPLPPEIEALMDRLSSGSSA